MNTFISIPVSTVLCGTPLMISIPCETSPFIPTLCFSAFKLLFFFFNLSGPLTLVRIPDRVQFDHPCLHVLKIFPRILTERKKQVYSVIPPTSVVALPKNKSPLKRYFSSSFGCGRGLHGEPWRDADCSGSCDEPHPDL